MNNFECLTMQNISKMDINQDFAQKYLEYLVHLMHLNKPIDFIQAALVMQTLSSVFAKKVDNLQEQILAFTVIFRKLELGNNVDDEAEENNDGQERGKSNRKKNVEKENIMRDFKNVCLANNIRKNFIKRWSDKDIKKVDPYSIRNRINECPKLKTVDVFSCYIFDNKLDKLGKKEEFEVNGILCNDLIPKENFCFSCTHAQDIWKINETVYPSDLQATEPFLLNNDHMDVEPLHDDDDNNKHSYHDVVEEFLNNSLNDKDHSISGHVHFERMNQVQERIVDVGGLYNMMWSPIGDDNKLLDKKIKKRNVKSIPEELQMDKENTDGRKYRAPEPTEYVLTDLLLALFKLKSNVPLHPYFSNGLKREKELRAKLKPKRNLRRAKNAFINDRNEDFRGFNEFGDVNDNNNNSFEHELDVHPGDANDADNCMDEAIQQIRNYQQGLYQNQLDDTVNDIALKVSAWHDSIRPHLEREEGRTNFDINEYGSEILSKFPSTNAKTSLSFSQCVQNQPREEIPRYFLSSLLLANSYNVDISKDSQDGLTVNDMMLTLLSRVRQHEVLDEGLRKDLS